MPFLSLNGITVPVETATASRSIKKMGSLSSAVSGALRNGTRALHRCWELTICYADYDEGQAFLNLLEGNGHFFDFSNGVEASTGLQPASMPKMSIMPNIWGLNGRGVAHVDAFQDNSYQGHFRVNASIEASNWTVLWSEAIGNGWQRAARKSNARGFLNGVQNNLVGIASGPTWNLINVFDGNLVMYANQGSGTMGLEDVLILPFHAPDAWLETWTSNPGPKLPSMPYLTATGDFISSPYGTAYVVGQVDNVSFAQMRRPQDNSWINNGMKITATLYEVDPYYVQSSSRMETTPQPPAYGDAVYHFDGSDFDGFANATYTNGATLTGWRNKGTAGGSAVQAGSVEFPVYAPYGLAPNLSSPSGIWNYSGGGASGKLQYDTANTYGSAKSALMVFRNLSSASVFRYMLDGNNSSNRTIFRIRSSIAMYSGNFVYSSPAYTMEAKEWAYVVGDFIGNSQFQSKLFINGQWVGSGDSGTQPLGGLAIGGLYGPNTSFHGQIAEVVVWQGNFSQTGLTISSIDQYVRAKHEGIP